MLRRLARNAQGVAMVEFAIVLPVLLIMYLGCFLISDMISCYRKVTSTTRAMTDLVSRNISPSAGLSSTTLTTYMTSSELVLSPYNAANATLLVANMRVCDATHAYVVWVQSQTGTTTLTSGVPLTAGTVVTIPTNLITSPMVPTSPDGSDVCNNTAASTSTKTQVGTAGGYLFYGQVSYVYTSKLSYNKITSTTMGDQLYMSPRLN